MVTSLRQTCLILIFGAITVLSFLLDLTSQHQNQQHSLLSQLHEAQIKVTQLESSLEEILQKNKANELYIEDQEQQILESQKILDHFQLSLLALKQTGPLPIDEKIIALEQEVRNLWATKRKNNFDIHVLHTKAHETEDRLQIVNSQVEEMSDIVSEQWIQIQQFEQALQLRQMTLLKARKQYESKRCSFLKFMNDLSIKYLPKSLGTLDSFGNLQTYISQVLNQLSRFYSTMKESHHELQGFIRREMEKHEFTAHFANVELVFFVASALIIFPVLSAWMLLSQ